MSNEYIQPFAALVRVWRWIRYRCLVCGFRVPGTRWWRFEQAHYRYCSITCGCYDGVMAVRTDVKVKDSRVLTGKTTWKRRTREEKYL